jgi:hypothetical protein
MCHSPFLGPGRNLSSGRTSSDSNSSRGVSDVSKSARRKVRRKISLGLVSRSTVPPGRVHFSLVSRHFVPGYFRLVPPGQNTLFRCRIFLKLALMERSGGPGQPTNAKRGKRARRRPLIRLLTKLLILPITPKENSTSPQTDGCSIN